MNKASKQLLDLFLWHNSAHLLSAAASLLSLTDQWEVDPEELTLGQELGSGQFGLVLEGMWRETKVAVKTIREQYMSDEEFKEEARVMM